MDPKHLREKKAINSILATNLESARRIDPPTPAEGVHYSKH